MDAVSLDHSSAYTIRIDDPRAASFSVTLYPCLLLDCKGDEKIPPSYCCKATFDPLRPEAIERLKRDWGNLSSVVAVGTSDIECRILGEVLQTLTIEEEGVDRVIEIPGLIPLIIRRCAADALYEVYIRTVPTIVDLLAAEGIPMPRARLILDRSDRGPVGDDGPDTGGQVDGKVPG